MIPLALEAWLDAVVLVHQGSAMCAGALVAPEGRVVTAYHCVAPGGRPLVTLRTGEHAVGRVVSVDRAADLAVIDVPAFAGRSWLPVASAPPAPGTPVWALGHPFGSEPPAGFMAGTLRWSAAAGAVSAVGFDALQISAPLNPGNSGGPVVDGEGTVVGVASRRLSGDGLGFASRADPLPALLAEGTEGLSPFGGTVALELFLASQDSASSGFAGGVRGEIALRDRVVIDAAGLVPFSPRWAAARFGSSLSGVAEARGGLRQRLGRGSWTVRLDGWAGVAAVQRIRSEAADPLALHSDVDPTWLVGGTVRIRHVGFELGWLPDVGMTRASAILRWPGVLTVF